MTTKRRKKVLVGWVYENEEYAWCSLSAWSDSLIGQYLCILKHKKYLGKFKGKKVRITIEELTQE